MNLFDCLERYTSLVDSELEIALNFDSSLYTPVIDAMKYSAIGGGKRLRPAILMEFCRVFCGDEKRALKFAAAIEMIHTYSLIHDDLPCMDNDDLRRGKPACHIAFGESTALLAGDALLSYAFKYPLSSFENSNSTIIEAVKILSECSGVNGMIGGQVVDLSFEKKIADLEVLYEICKLKTGALIVASATIGATLAEVDEQRVNAAREYAINIGLAFQIYDDILDIIGDTNLLGKPTGSDKASGKSTFVSLLGIDRAKDTALKYAQLAKESLLPYVNKKDTFLFDLADYCVSRDH